ncbi:MAG TPA: hypothetical protein VIK37_00030 [Candidatus Saccharimonadales bacterium]
MDGEQSIHSQLLEKVRDYRMPPAARDLLNAHLPLVIVGITASGKSSVTDYIKQTSDYRQVITHTTRQPRPGEVHGQHYYFISDEDMIKMMADEALVEVQTIHSHEVYGISLSAYQTVLKGGYKPLLIIDVQGVEEISQYVPKLRPVFLLPASFDEWMRMLEKRGRMSHAERLRRMHSAHAELEKVLEKEKFFFVTNRDVPSTARDILGDVHDHASQRRGRETAQLLIDRLKTT